MLVAPAAAGQTDGPGRDPRSITLPNDCDHIGAEVHSLTHDARTSYYIDQGKTGQGAVVFRADKEPASRHSS